MAKTLTQEFTKGLWDEIPPFRLVLGLCPTLAVTKTVYNGIGMGIATTFVLVCSNLLISALRNVIPDKVRIACFIIVIATFVTIVELVMQAYSYPLFEKLGIFIPLIVVNCIVLGRAEAFALQNPPVLSVIDGLANGVGYAVVLAIIGFFRELLGTGEIIGITVLSSRWYTSNQLMILAPGAFFALGIVIAIFNYIKGPDAEGTKK